LLASHIREAWFDPDTWPGASPMPGHSTGRGTTLVIGTDRDEWVLRHYYRGGLVGRVLNDTFLWLGEARTRPFTEWLLLEHLVTLGLPVPRPVAGRFVRRGPVYTADLITVRIPDVVPLSRRWTDGPLDPMIWRSVGELVGRFHDHAVYHADLNAHNIQIGPRGELFLLDFDQGRIMDGAGAWTGHNLSRLRRSLSKISRSASLAFSDQEWGWLLAGYRQAFRG
jgi:3-deoxy-D-manno-octulosonic acid kinase